MLLERASGLIALRPDGADEVRMNVQTRKFDLFELFALAGQQMRGPKGELSSRRPGAEN